MNFKLNDDNEPVNQACSTDIKREIKILGYKFMTSVKAGKKFPQQRLKLHSTRKLDQLQPTEPL